MEEIKLGFVYKITNPNNRIYIGSTNNIKRRISQYKGNYHKGQIKIYRSIKKYGWENHKFEILWCGNVKDKLKKEAFFGNKFNVLDIKNLNLLLPKAGTNYKTVSDETRKKMSGSRNWKMSEEHKKIISDTHKNKIVSKETREKMSQWQIGRKMSKEAKLKMSKAALGKKVSKETRQKISIFQSKPILQFDLKNNFIKEWKSAAEAGEKLKINSSHIGACCREQRKTSGKFKWQFKKLKEMTEKEKEVKIVNFIKNNNLTFSDDGSGLNSECCIISGYALHIGITNVNVLSDMIENSLEDVCEYFDELYKVFNFAQDNDYGHFWTTKEAKKQYKF